MNLVLLGDPVDHSRSPAIHQAALDTLGIAGSYLARRVDLAGLDEAVREIRMGLLDGANVTMPHKEAAAAAVDRLVGPAARAGAANTLVATDDDVAGYLTDIDGVRRGWSSGGLSDDGPVLVLGAGGAAAAALLALEGRQLHLSARRPEAARILCQRLGMAVELHEWAVPLNGGTVVNATPLGMRGESLPAGIVEAAAGLFEMAYGDSPTPATLSAQQRGIPAVDGLEMLLGQAFASFVLWTGLEAPEEAMRIAVAPTFS